MVKQSHPTPANGNGHGSALARTTPPDPMQNPTAAELMKPPPWLSALRDALAGSIQPDDIKEVMAAQVKKAKEGDKNAAAFVMNQAHKLMTTQAMQPPVTIIQNNYYDDSQRPDAPIEPGDELEGADIRKLRNRARAGVPVTGHPNDRRVRPVTDEEEKELRRRQQAEETEAEGDPLRD